MITRVSGLAMVLAITLAFTLPALAQNDITINDKGVVYIGGDLVVGKCSDLLQHRDEVPDLMDAVRACEKAGSILESIRPQTRRWQHGLKRYRS